MKPVFVRSQHNPILEPEPGNEWESSKVYNPGAIYESGEYHLFYRGMSAGPDWRSSVCHARSSDGEHFKRDAQPVFGRDATARGAIRGYEDPRVVRLENKFVMTFAAYDGVSPRLHTASSHDLVHWVQHGPALKDFDLVPMGGVFVKNRGGTIFEYRSPRHESERQRSKSGGIFSERINGFYWMLFNEYRIWLAFSTDGRVWETVPTPFLSPRKSSAFFDNGFVEMGPPPIKTKAGWLVFYNGVDRHFDYRLGALLLDLDDPASILGRSQAPLLEPETPYELAGPVDIMPGFTRALANRSPDAMKQLITETVASGHMPGVVFVSGAVLRDDIVHIFYGAGDQCISVATARLDDILASLI